ncbi:MAG: hypothetical protein KAH01_05990, partial [Caldisericia bacterium]|nr:hypothetical protein [Caldisericia bacterium]
IPGFDRNFKSHGGYVIKVNPEGTKLDFSTFISGTNFDEIYDIAIDNNGCSYITGSAESTDDESFPIGGGIPGFDQIHNELKDAFVIKIDSSGTRLIYSTYIGGDKNDEGICIIVDENDCAYVTGTTFSKEKTFPVSDSIPGFYKHHKEHEDVFCIKLNPEGTDLLYASYLGGSDEDLCHSICLGPDNELFVSGDTRSDDGGFPTGGRYPGLFPIFSGNIDSFLVEINTVGDDILFSTFFGGRMEEENTFCVLSNNNIFLAGKTTSTENDNPSFPILPDIPGFSKRNRGGSGDVYVAKITFDEPKEEEPKPSLDTYISSDKITLKQNRQDTQTLTIKNLGEKDSVLEGTFNIETDNSSTNVGWLTINRNNFKLLESEVLDAEIIISSSELDPGEYNGTI